MLKYLSKLHAELHEECQQDRYVEQSDRDRSDCEAKEWDTAPAIGQESRVQDAWDDAAHRNDSYQAIVDQGLSIERCADPELALQPFVSSRQRAQAIDAHITRDDTGNKRGRSQWSRGMLCDENRSTSCDRGSFVKERAEEQREIQQRSEGCIRTDYLRCDRHDDA